ncbi:MAG: glycosyltransferase [Candidatus Omnitrophica bacterium]|nr:glycosyltransferase [Candidatus Omnitrophota bacterium]
MSLPDSVCPTTLCPEETARSSLTLEQKLVLILLFLGAVACVNHHLKTGSYLPHYVISLLYLTICFHKLILVFQGVVRHREIEISEVEILSCHQWPIYTILLPLYREREIIPQLCQAIEKLDYPKDRLEILLILEEDDKETIDAVQEAHLPPWWQLVVVPDQPPKTKGKALNYGLARAHGEYLVIYDAEDIPEFDQLKKAVLAFRRLSEKIVCLQAKLNYYNPYQNILTGWFTAEYSTWFDLYLPGISSLEAPVPLGGTSNHFRTAVLKDLKGWDPFNVTEDCDLGIRIFRAGYRTAILDTTTWEEANSQLANWIKQRSRWVKGYIQTYFVHLRQPGSLLRSIGLANFFHFNLIVGGNFTVLCFNPIAWLLFISWLIYHWQIGLPLLAFLRLDTLSLSLFLGNFIFVGIHLLGCLKRKYYRLLLPTFFSPVYWVLMSVGAWKGLWQYLFRPHYWEKTDHALFLKKIPFGDSPTRSQNDQIHPADLSIEE